MFTWGPQAPPAAGGPAPVASFWAMRSGSPAYTLYNGFTGNGFAIFGLPPGSYPLAAAEQNAFRIGTGAAVAINIGAAETFEALTGTAVYTDLATGVGVTTNGSVATNITVEQTDEGRYSVAWRNASLSTWIPTDGGSRALATTSPQVSDTALSITFSRPVAAFGAYLIDFGEFGARVTYEFYRNDVLLLALPHTPTITGTTLDGSVGFVGHIAVTNNSLFDKVLVKTTVGGTTATDFYVYDNCFIGVVEQISAVRASVGQSIQFTDTSSNSPTSWLWNFGDGTTSTLQNPTKSYSTAGTRAVTLTATNANGSGSITKTGYVIVT